MTYSKLKIQRIKKGWSQGQLSKETNICRATISQIENGKIDSVQFGTLKKIAAALNCSMNELFLSE
ncbi:MAG: helix-turn-helix transcriptional regulator [Clostridium butyricum]|uniref:helix-turn-helix domain-containing protein n=1 Tax=Clostridium butyricum TaxID=1492 RepID=UPI0005EB2F6B|nr:helix-turn-helix transcriptional regulator [Clostridium butyricum]MDU4750299.1 helix-turn-helix transcriptional regulator [Clostridium butyricum]MDU4853388.1 helix-turn-helix transcriptional regulator [Clostridioides difficile]